MSYLLDVNVIISILDPEHIHHLKLQRWFEGEGHTSITEITVGGAGDHAQPARTEHRRVDFVLRAARARQRWPM